MLMNNAKSQVTFPCSKSTIETQEKDEKCVQSLFKCDVIDVVLVSLNCYELISNIFLAFLLLTLNKKMLAGVARSPIAFFTEKGYQTNKHKLKAQRQHWKQQKKNMLKVNRKERHQNDVNDVVLVSLLLTLNRCHIF